MADPLESPEKLEVMRRVNRAQAEYYDSRTASRGNPVTRLWRRARQSQERVRKAVGIQDTILDLHRDWLGDLSDRRVLDLGCHAGNALSLEIAARAGEYLGVDLSREGIERLEQRLHERGIDGARARAVDFLSDEFDEPPFDVVYAHSVVHHFEHLDAFLDRLHDVVVPGGLVVTLDPLQTSVPVRLVRAAYRPFQSDRAWEWPLDRRSFDLIRSRFRIESVQGVLGSAKWCLPLAAVDESWAARVGRRLHRRDMARANRVGAPLWGCMQVTMRWRRD